MAKKSPLLMSLTETQSDKNESNRLLSEHMSQLYLNDSFADVTFITSDGEQVPAHRLVLAARSSCFKVLFSGEDADRREIKVRTPAEPFKVILRYLYSGRLSLASVAMETFVQILSLAHQYAVERLVAKMEKRLVENLSCENVVAIFVLAQLYDLHSLSEHCLKLVDPYAAQILQNESFLDLARKPLCVLLRRDSFFAPEIEIFRFVRKWMERHPEEKPNAAEVTSLIRLPLLTQDQLFDEVTTSGLIEPLKIVEALSAKRFPQNLVQRHSEATRLNENVATSTLSGMNPSSSNRFPPNAIRRRSEPKKVNGNVANAALNASVLKGLNPSNLLSETKTNFTYHDKGDPEGILIKLGDCSQINRIRMRLCSTKLEIYSYYVEISIDQKHWVRVIDYSAYKCRSWQSLFFDTRPVHYIRLVGTKHGLKVNSFEANCIQNMPKIINQFVEAIENVATFKMGAKIVTGRHAPKSSSADVLLNGYMNFDTESGWTYHEIGKGSITIQLAQPFVVGSMGLLLYVRDEFSYSFYIETSIDREIWEMAVDKRGSLEHGWVNFTFDPRPTVFVRIVGTKCNKNSLFSCVHFECPSQPILSLGKKRRLEQQQRGTKLNKSFCVDSAPLAHHLMGDNHQGHVTIESLLRSSQN